jgi:class 3 adenylate cyclase
MRACADPGMSLAEGAIMQLTFMQPLLAPSALLESWLSDLSHLGNSALTSLRVLPAPMRARALARAYRRPPRVTLLVTDLVGFSALITTLGDRAAHKLIHTHNSLLRACLREHGGREVAHTGDGIIASFGNPIAAARCAVHIQESLREQRARTPETPLRARIGLHTGRPLPEEGRLFGGCVNFAVRVCSVADAGEILVSDCVKGLIEQYYACCERPPVGLKGFEGSHRLHALGQTAMGCE